MTAILTTPRTRPLSSLFDEMFQDFFNASGSRSDRSSLPAMNVAETQTAFELAFELPGVEESDISVHVDDGQLVVSAERKFESEKTEGRDYHRVEHRYGRFARSLTLPKDVQADAIQATYKRGVLTVVVPKSEPSQARRIEIRSE